MSASDVTSTPATGKASLRDRRESADSSWSRTARDFRLTGPSARPDPRINAFREDLADIRLSSTVLAPHYARALVRACGSRAAFIRAAEGEDPPVVSELLPGQDFAVLEYAGGWAWGYAVADHVVGYVEAIALVDRMEPTHIVCERSAPVMADDDITAPLLATLPMGALLQGEEDGASLASEYGRVSLAHLRRIDEHEADPVVVAERLLGAPYLPGGRTAEGIDAGGLVQLALSLCGVAVSRFPDLLATAGEAPSGPPQRGDLAVGGDVIGLMIDDRMMIHASAAAGKVAVEPLAEGAVLRRLTP